MLYELVEGWTSPIDITLLTRGEKPPNTMAGMTVEILLEDREGNALETTGDLSIQDTDNWIVRFTPDEADLIPGNYYGRIKVTDEFGGNSYFPSGDPDIWVVKPETAP